MNEGAASGCTPVRDGEAGTGTRGRGAERCMPEEPPTSSLSQREPIPPSWLPPPLLLLLPMDWDMMRSSCKRFSQTLLLLATLPLLAPGARELFCLSDRGEIRSGSRRRASGSYMSLVPVADGEEDSGAAGTDPVALGPKDELLLVLLPLLVP